MKGILSIISFWSIAVYGQIQLRTYFDREGNGCPPESSYCYSIREKNRDVFSYDTVRFYYTKNNRLQSIGLGDRFGNRLGFHESFYENGNLKSKRRFEVRRGKKKETDPDSIVCAILEFNDSLGHPMVQNGEGFVRGKLDFLVEQGNVVNGLRDSVWTTYYADGNVYCFESWHLGELIDGISYDLTGKDYYYERVLIPPEPIGGFQNFFQLTSRKIIYPKDAQRRSLEGKVLVQVMVEKDGTIASPEIVKGIGFGCDEEALKAVVTSSPWMPGKRRGQLINHKVIIPIVFKLR